jgi:hypothetical protein
MALVQGHQVHHQEEIISKRSAGIVQIVVGDVAVAVELRAGLVRAGAASK